MATNTSNYDLLIGKLDRFTRKFYFNKLIRGTLYTVGLLVGLFLLLNLLESKLYFSSVTRQGLRWGYLLTGALSLGYWVLMPLMNYFKLGKIISHQQAAEIIGTHFGDVQDKLLNVLQLKSQSANQSSSKELIEASIDQKIDGIKLVPFRQAIDLSVNKKYLKYALLPLLLLIGLIFGAPGLIKDSSNRLFVNPNLEFEKPAPFHFTVKDADNLEAIQYDDFLLSASADGTVLPANAEILINDFPYAMSKVKDGSFQYKFNKVQKTAKFRIRSGEITSKEYTLNVIPKPAIASFTANMDYPRYVGKKDEKLTNTGDMVVPAGTKVLWKFDAENTDAVEIRFGKGDKAATQRNGKSLFTYEQRLMKDAPYTIFVSSERVPNADSIGYNITVIPDMYPQIGAKQIADSTDNKLIYFLGDAQDDYGISKIDFVYNITGENGSSGVVPIEKGSLNKTSRFTYTWDLRSLDLKAGNNLTYFFEVWDNDGVNGNKSARSNTMSYELPSIDELEALADQSKEEFKDELKENKEEAEALKEEFKKMQEKIVEKKELDWQDRKQMEKMLERQKDMMENMENVQNKMEENNKKEEEFKNVSEEMKEKKEKLEEMLSEMLTEEMKEKLEKLTEDMEEMTPEEMMEELEDMELTNEQLEREMERMEELFKQLEMEQKVEETVEKLQELAEKEEELAQKTGENETGDFEEEQKEQEEIAEEFEKVKEDIEEISEMNEELGDKMEGMEEQQEQAEQAEQEMQESQQEMQEGQKQDAQESQEDAAEQMQQMAQQMQQQMQQMQQEQEGEDLQAIRQLLENLIDMSYDQEVVMEDIAAASVNTPGYVEYVQQQYKLKDDFQIIEDSVVSLANRTPQIESFILKELSEIERNFGESIDRLEDRKKKEATVNQQYIMTSVNNLALMLSESMQQMQQQMMSGMPGSGSCNKPGGSGAGISKMKKMQMQLNKQLSEMMQQQQGGEKPGQQGQAGEQKGKDPKGSSKQFAETAKQQAAIREAMRQLNEQQNKSGEGDLGDLEKLMDEMEKTEEQLVNKNITRELIERQKEILTRLLEAEEAERQREYDNKRQGETAQEIERQIPPEIEEYLKKRNAEVELYKTVSPELRPYYKSLVEKYFKDISF